MFKLLLLGLVAAGAWFGFQELKGADPDQIPVPTQYVPPPDVDINVPVPGR